MYVDTAKTVLRGKTYYRHLLRDSYRENGKVKHNTIANLSRCSEVNPTDFHIFSTGPSVLSKLVDISARD